jgi:hypothetical protein
VGWPDEERGYVKKTRWDSKIHVWGAHIGVGMRGVQLITERAGNGVRLTSADCRRRLAKQSGWRHTRVCGNRITRPLTHREDIVTHSHRCARPHNNSRPKKTITERTRASYGKSTPTHSAASTAPVPTIHHETTLLAAQCSCCSFKKSHDKKNVR